MNATDLTQLLHTAFGERTLVSARRPDRLFQIAIPAYLTDGDAPSIYVEPLDADRVLMSDQGMTAMRLSYTSAVNDASMNALARLAEQHGFRLQEGSLVAEVKTGEIIAGALGLLQIESEAEATVKASVARGKHGEQFKAMILEVLQASFKEECQVSYHDEAIDPKRMWGMDARIAVGAKDLLIAVTPNEAEAERAMASKLFMELHAPTGPGVAKPNRQWIAIPRDANELESRTRLRLMQQYLVPVPRYEEEPDQLERKLRAFG